MKSKYIFGKKALLDAINNGLDIDHVFILKNSFFDVDILDKNKIDYSYKDISFFNQNNFYKKETIAFTINKSNNLLSFDELSKKLEKIDNALVLILDEIQDAGNMGAILRSADAFGVDAIIFKKHNQVSPFHSIAIKNSTNAISYLTFCEVSNISQTIEKLKKLNFWIYASSLTNTSNSYSNEQYSNKTAFIVGNENNGVSRLVQQKSDVLIHINQYGNVQSLNVSVATGILLSFFRIKYPKK